MKEEKQKILQEYFEVHFKGIKEFIEQSQKTILKLEKLLDNIKR